MAYNLSYADIQEDAQYDAKSRERELLRRSIKLMKAANVSGAHETATVEAVHFTSRVWTAFLEDLAGQENALPDEMRGSLISIGIRILKQLEGVRTGKGENFDEVVEISEIIMEGLH